MTRLGVALVCGLILAGCAGPQSPPAGTQYDGIYRGQDTLLTGVAFQCGQPSLSEQLEVRNGRFTYPFQVSPPRTAPLPVQVAADGSMAGQMQFSTGEEIPNLSRDRVDWVFLQGSIGGDIMDATIGNMRCHRHLMAHRG